MVRGKLQTDSAVTVGRALVLRKSFIGLMWSVLLLLPQARSSPIPEPGEQHDKTQELTSVSATTLRQYVVELSADGMAGRGAGYTGEKRAARYIAAQFKELRLSTCRARQGYYQDFSFYPRASQRPWQRLIGRNVIGCLPGKDPARILVIGAHFDGQGKAGDADPGRRGATGSPREIWPSADDNASGVAALLEIARLLVERGVRPLRTIMFVAFSAEEHGLNGSAFFVKHAPAGIEAMLNIEKLGRAPAEPLIVASSATASMWRILLEETNAVTGQAVRPLVEGLIADTDHYPFAIAGIPAMVIGVAHDENTHTPLDSADRISVEALTQRCTYIASLVRRLGDYPEPIRFEYDLTVEPGFAAVPASAEEKMARGVEPATNALKINAVYSGSIAAHAGVKEGDLVTSINSGEPPSKLRKDYLRNLFGSCRRMYLDLVRQGPSKVVLYLGSEATRQPGSVCSF